MTPPASSVPLRCSFVAYVERARACLVLLALLSVGIDNADAYTFGTFAGAEHANVDGIGSDARFGAPRSVAVDRLGNIYVSDQANFTIRKVTPTGVVTTLAGSPGQSGTTNGVGSAARFGLLHGLTVDANDTVYVISGSAVRRITPDGTVTTLAGRDDEPGSTNGDNSVARLNLPEGIARDVAGNIYVLEPYPGGIRKIAVDGIVTTYAGELHTPVDQDGSLAVATFSQPTSLTIDSNGNLYVSSFTKIRKITPAGEVSTLAGSSAGYLDGTGSNALFSNPLGLTADTDGNVYVVEPGEVVRKVSAEGAVVTLAGTNFSSGSDDGIGAAARFMYPTGIAINAAGVLYVCDRTAGTIRAISTANAVTTLAGSIGRHRDGPAANALFKEPQAFARDMQGNTFVADRGNHTIRKITATGIVSTLAGIPGIAGSTDGPGTTARFNAPTGIAIESGGSLLVTDTGNFTVRRIGVDGVVTTFAGKTGQAGSADGAATEATFQSLHGIAIDEQGNAFVTDPGNRTIRRITPAGVVTTVAGAAGERGTNDGMGAAARFVTPRGIAVRADGTLVIVDNGAMTVRTVGVDGLVQTLAGLPDAADQTISLDGTGAAARFSYPEGVAVSSAGDIFVTELFSNLLRKISPAGVVTTEFTLNDASWPVGRWAGLSVDGSGRLYIADGRAGVIRIAAPAGVSLDPELPTPPSEPPPSPPLPEPVKDARLVNLSVRARTGSGDGALIAGFVVSGVGKQVLVRGLGPTLAIAGVSAALADPVLSLFDRTRAKIGGNDNWGGTDILRNKYVAVGAGALAADSKDAAILVDLDGGPYTAHITSADSSTGVALVEMFDVTTDTTARLVNVSARAQVLTGDDILIAGFVIAGNTSRTLLIRGLGPSLTPRGVEGALADPQLRIYNSTGTKLYENDDWAGLASLKEVFTRVGAGDLISDTSKDAALLLILEPGVYTAHVIGANNSTGVGLVEIFEVP